MFSLLLTIPLITAILAVVIFKWLFYGVRHNQFGAPKASGGGASQYFAIFTGGKKDKDNSEGAHEGATNEKYQYTGSLVGWPEDPNKRRKVIIATLEYEIIDWKLKVKYVNALESLWDIILTLSF